MKKKSAVLVPDAKNTTVVNDDGLARDDDHPGMALVHAYRSISEVIIQQDMPVIEKALNEAIASGEISELLGVTILTSSVSQADIHVVEIQHYDISRKMMESDVKFWVVFNTADDEAEYDMGVTLAISFEDERQCEVVSIWDSDKAPDRQKTDMMDEYMNQNLSTIQRENIAENIWVNGVPGGLTNPDMRSPELLAEAYGIEIVEEQMSGGPSSALYLTGADVEFIGDSGPEVRTLLRDTIIRNVDSKGKSKVEDSELYGHIAAYCMKYKQMRLNGLFCDNFSTLPQEWRTEKEAEKLVRVGEKIQWFTSQVGLALMLPRDFIEDYIQKNTREVMKTDRYFRYWKHEAFCLEEIAKKLIQEYPSISKRAIKGRYTQLGFTQSKGIFNQTDFHPMDAFAISSEEMVSGHYTVAIGRRIDALKLFYRSPEFRSVMETGEFVFADGMILRNSSIAVQDTRTICRPTPEANGNADVYGLWFTQKWMRNKHRYEIGFGKENYDIAMEIIDKSPRYGREVAESKDAQISRIKDSSSFHRAFSELMHARSTVDNLSELSTVRVSRINELCRVEQKHYDLDELIMLCIGLKLEPYLSYALLEKAGVSFEEDKEGFDPNYRRGILCLCFRDRVYDLFKWFDVVADDRYQPVKIKPFGM